MRSQVHSPGLPIQLLLQSPPPSSFHPPFFLPSSSSISVWCSRHPLRFQAVGDKMSMSSIDIPD